MEAESALSNANELTQEADWIERVQLSDDAVERLSLRSSIKGEDRFEAVMSHRYGRLKSARDGAEHLRTLAASITLFCDFMDCLEENRQRIVSP